jgi:phasin family protein
MANNPTHFVSQAQNTTGSLHGTVHDLIVVQMNVFQRLSEVQQKAFNQAVEATKTQLQLLSLAPDPREFASAQADLVKEYGQRYADCTNQAIEVMLQAWEEYGDRLGKNVNTVTDKTQQAASPRKAT